MADDSEQACLRDTWPSFLDLLDEDPNAAFDEFSRMALYVLTRRPPRVLGQLPPADRDDIVQEVIVHCRKDDFQALRRFEDRGIPFAAWLQRTAANKTKDYLRAQRSTEEFEEQDSSPADGRRGTTDGNDIESLIDITVQVMSELRIECRLLLVAAAMELSGFQMAQLLGWPRIHNKKAANMARECRRTLRRVLSRVGVDLENAMPLIGRARA